MRAGFKDVVLEIILVEQHEAALITDIGELAEARPIPRIEPGQIVFAEAQPCLTLTTAGKGLFKERREHVAVNAADAFVVIAPFLGPRTRERLADEGLGYVDLVGNMRLVLDRPTVFISSRGWSKRGAVFRESKFAFSMNIFSWEVSTPTPMRSLVLTPES